MAKKNDKNNVNAEKQNVNPENVEEKNVVAPQTDANAVDSNGTKPENGAAKTASPESEKPEKATKEPSFPVIDDVKKARQALLNELDKSAGILTRACAENVPGWRQLSKAIFAATEHVENVNVVKIDKTERANAIARFNDYQKDVELKRLAFETHDLARLQIAEATFLNVAFDGFRFVVDVPFAARSTQFGEKRNASVKTFVEKGFTAPVKLPEAFKTFADIYRWTLPTGRFMRRFAALCAVYEESAVFNGEEFRLVAVEKEVIKLDENEKPVLQDKKPVYEKVWYPELIPAALVDGLSVRKIVFGSPALYREETNGAIGRSGKAKTTKGQFFAETVAKTVQGYLTLFYFDKLLANEVRYNETK